MRYFLPIILAIVAINLKAATTIDVAGITYAIQSKTSATLAVSPSSSEPYSGDVVIPSTVNYDGKTWTVIQVDRHAFASCPDLTKVTLPSTVTTLMDYIFEDTPNLQTVEMPGVTMIYDMSFYNAGIRSIILPETLQRMRNAVFYNCKNLVSVKIPASLTYMGNNAPFPGCTNLVSIEVEDANEYFASKNGLLYSKDGTILIDCPAGLETAEISHGTLTLRMGACKGNQIMRSITLPSTVNNIEQYVFDGCDSLTDIFVDESNHTFKSIDGALYSGTKFTLCPRGRSSIEVIDGTTELGEYSLSECTRLSSVKLPSTLTTISSHAFENCISLTHIELPQSLTTIKNMAFYRCSSLESIVIPDKVESIELGTFHLCSSLRNVTLGKNLKTIKSTAFTYCPEITEFNVYSEVPPEVEVSYLGFVAQDVYSNATLNVPIGSSDVYYSASPWNLFNNIKETDFSGIEDVKVDPDFKDQPMYDLNGRRIYDIPVGSIYIQAGKKFIAK